MKTLTLPRRGSFVSLIVSMLVLAGCSSGNDDATAAAPDAQKPNILFIVIDDFGLDQMTSYGYGGALPPKTPNLTAIARAGLQFRSAWAMPTCTPTRATFFTGRYPSATNVLNAVVSTDLANSEISPYEVTLPKLLRTQGYTSALIGKMHLTGTDRDTAPNLPFGHQTMWKLGWDYFDGYLDGAPFPIDTRAGLTGDRAAGTHQCGFIANKTVDPVNGADAGACYAVTGACESITRGPGISTPGRTCMERGGIFDPGQSCQLSRPGYVDFSTQNGYYTGEFVQSWPDGRTRKIGAEDPSARGYRSTMETDRAVAWVRQQGQETPWMMSLGYSAIHTPLQSPPLALVSDSTPGRNDNLSCSPATDLEGVPGTVTTLIDNHIVSNLMVEAMDTEIGRLLVELGLATRNQDGTLNYQPEKTNTVVVVMGDNGTYVNSVKFTAPGRFDPTRAKAFPYQTGVSVPLLIAGPMVQQPGREITHPVSSPDLYRLFAEIAGANVEANVPANRPVDAQPMLAYLTSPGQTAIRSLNFSEMGTNFSNPSLGIVPQPCVVEAANVCFTIFPQKALCEDQGGFWYGAGSDDKAVPPAGFSQCGQVMSYRKSQNPNDKVDVLPDSQKAVSDGSYKLVRLNRKTYTTVPENPISSSYIENQNTDELYEIDMAVPNPKLDRSDNAIAIGSPTITAMLPAAAQQAYGALKAEMDLRDRVAAFNYQYDTLHCPGDGNRDGAVDQKDLDLWVELSQRNLNNGVAQSSWYDLNHDGKTDGVDRALIEANLGRSCALSPG